MKRSRQSGYVDIPTGFALTMRTKAQDIVGPLYLLKGAGAPETAPLLFGRVKGALVDLDSWLLRGTDAMRSPDPICTLPICDGESLVFGDDGSMECANPTCPNFGRGV